MTWGLDVTSRYLADLVGLEDEIAEAIDAFLARWVTAGPPLTGRRELAGFIFYEHPIRDRYLLGYTVKDDPPAFAVLWLRTKPGSAE